MSFGKWLKAKRTEKRFTQKGLALAAGNVCTGAYISSLERESDVGKSGLPTTPSKEIVDALAVALGESKAEARREAGYDPGDSAIAEGHPVLQLTQERLKRLIESHPSLSVEDWDQSFELFEFDVERKAKRHG